MCSFLLLVVFVSCVGPDFPTPQPTEGSPEPTGLDGAASGLRDALAGIGEEKDGSADDAAAGAGASGSCGDKPFVEDSADKAIRQALVFGDFKAAVTKCLETGRMADAIVFASFGPPQLWEETRKEYFKQHKSPFIRHVMKSVAQEVRRTTD